MPLRILKSASALIVTALSIGSAQAELPQLSVVQPIEWRSNYQEGMELAASRRKMLLVWFCDEKWAAQDAKFEANVLNQPRIAARIHSGFVAVRVPLEARVPFADGDIRLLDHEAFEEMHGAPGIAILDLTDDQSPQHRRVVSVYPFSRQYITHDKLAVMLDLPQGTLTQRTLIFAVRTHRDRPASTLTDFSPILADETERAAYYQATITDQGHHNWESRFHGINARLPGGLYACEVVAESWPGQTLVDAAEECVDSWRHSHGHWEAVVRTHAMYGYDMKRGVNGVWYACGIFASPPF
jgi:hypothetical protein